MDIIQAIRKAEALLPGVPSDELRDPRWEAITEIGEFVESNAEEVWQFIRRWGCYAQQDLRGAIACCLLEHLLEHYFVEYFPLVERLALEHIRFGVTFSICSKLGQAGISRNSERFDALNECIRKQRHR